jgi:predicted RecB family nuclease
MPNQELPLVPRLSKSKYLSGLQCHKRLYLEIRSPELATEIDEAGQARMDMGTEVGELARKRFPGGVHVEFDHFHLPEALQQTAELLKDPKVPAIFEGTFQHENVLVRVDILERVGNGKWRLIEVKAAGEVKDEHLPDVALQTYVLKGAGVPLSGSWLLHLNKEYVYPGGELDLAQLFTIQDVSAEVSALQAEVATHLAAMRAMLASPSPPDIQPDHHCSEPYECSFWAYCTKDKPERWVYHLPGGKRTYEKLASQGIHTIDEIPAGFKLTEVQQKMKAGAEWISASLKSALQTVNYPVHHLDFETLMLAIPKYQQTRPYQTIPFQWSNHVVETEIGTARHEHYLCAERKDPREELALSMIKSLGQEGSICVYSGYEKRMLTELGGTFPKLKPELDRIIERLWDLLSIIKAHYYHPAFEGSFSIKATLPAVLPSLGYGDLEIQEGGMASLQFYKMIFEATDPAEKERIRQALLKYCERDTLAMVELRRALLRKARTQAGKIPSP